MNIIAGTSTAPRRHLDYCTVRSLNGHKSGHWRRNQRRRLIPWSVSVNLEMALACSRDRWSNPRCAYRIKRFAAYELGIPVSSARFLYVNSPRSSTRSRTKYFRGDRTAMYSAVSALQSPGKVHPYLSSVSIYIIFILCLFGYAVAGPTTVLGGQQRYLVDISRSQMPSLLARSEGDFSLF